MTGVESKLLAGAMPDPTVVYGQTTVPNGAQLENGSGAARTEKQERGKAMRQIVAAFIANTGTLNTGLVFGFSAVAIPQLKAADSLITIDMVQASWIASIASMATPIGCILTGYLMDLIGRRKAILLTQLPVIIGWLLIASATNLPMIYCGRMLTGLGSGMIGAPARVYTSEVTQPHLRGMLGALASVFISLGVLFQYVLGSITTWQVLSGISALCPLLAFVLMLLMPESPNYLVVKERADKARKSLAKLRGSTFNVDGEVHRLQQFTEQQKLGSDEEPTFHDTLKALISPSSLKPFGILVLYFMMYQFSGVNTITFYAVEIFQETGTSMNKNACTILLGVTRLLFTVGAAIAMRRCGRRALTFVSGIGCGVTMVGLGVYMQYKFQWDHAEPPIEPVHSWIPVMCIFVFTMTCTVGFLVVPWVMIGELYPQKVRGVLGGMTTCMAHTFVFIVVKTYPFLSLYLERHGTFILYGCISFVGTVFFYYCLPETKGKTLQEIEDYFSGRTTSLGKSKTNGMTKVSQVEEPIVEKNKLLSA